MLIDREAVEWKSTGILRIGETSDYEYQFDLPEPLASWDVFDYWERARFHSMRDHLEPGMVLFDVGTEQGWCNLVYASMVGPQNVVLVEPTSEFWPNIRATWERNYPGVRPRACYDGLISDETTDTRQCMVLTSMPPKAAFDGWPTYSGGPLIDRNKYQYVHEHADGIFEMRLDDLVPACGVPDALTIDVEGAELLALRGAEQTLQNHHPLVWVSVHSDLGERDYGVTPDQVHDFMGALGYQRQHLATDHEEHWFYS